ncbi:50S ribosomal protein L16, partial [Striga asiatica]
MAYIVSLCTLIKLLETFPVTLDFNLHPNETSFRTRLSISSSFFSYTTNEIKASESFPLQSDLRSLTAEFQLDAAERAAFRDAASETLNFDSGIFSILYPNLHQDIIR